MRDRLLGKAMEGNTEYFYNSWTWRKKRLEIIERDNEECQVCKENGKVTTLKTVKFLTVHHIKELKDFPELMLDDDNLITVCFNCHESIHDRGCGKKNIGDKMGIPERW